MKTLLLSMVAALVLSAPASSQTILAFPQTPFSFTLQTLPGAIPTSNTCIIGPAVGCLVVIAQTPTSTNPYLCSIDLTATGQTILVQDGQSPAIPWIVASGALGSMGTPTGWSWIAGKDDQCRVFPNGLYISASGTGVTGHFTFKWNK